MTPTGVKEEGSVWRRKEEEKKPVNLTKRLRNTTRTVGGGPETERHIRRAFHWWILWHFASDRCIIVVFKTSVHLLHYLKRSYLRDKCADSGAPGMFCAPEETWWRKKSWGWTSIWFSELYFLRITREHSDFFACHWTTLPVGFGIYPLIWVDAGWLWNSKLKKTAPRRFLVHCGVVDIPPSGFSSCSLLPFLCMPKQRSPLFYSSLVSIHQGNLLSKLL